MADTAQRIAAIFTRLINCCWSLFVWGLFLAVIAALAGGGYIYLRLDDEICRHVQHLFADHYPHLLVKVGKARLEQGQGIVVQDLSLMENSAHGPPQAVLTVDELFLACDARLEEMVSGKPKIGQIAIRRLRLRAVRSAAGRWNVQELLPLPKFSDETPEMSIEDATVILEDETQHAVAPLSLRGIDIKLTPVASPGGTGNAPALVPQVTRSAAGNLASPAYQFSGQATGVPARRFSFKGTVSPESGAFDLAVDIRALEVSPELAAAIPGPMPVQLDGVDLYGSADATLHVSRASEGEPVTWSSNIEFSRGRLGHNRLPVPLSEVAATIHADSQKLVIEQATARYGAADVVLACERSGWGPGAPLGLAGRIQGLAVNHELQAALPCGLERIWQRFRPTGIVDAELRLTFDGRKWQPELKTQCRNMSLTDAEKFPYPLEQAHGTVAVSRAPDGNAMRLDLDLVGLGGGQPIRIAAQLGRLAMPNIGSISSDGDSVGPGNAPTGRNGVQLASAVVEDCPLPKPTGWVEVSGIGVPIHEQLVAALPERAQPFVRSLRPQGLIDFRWRYERSDPHALRGDTSLELKLADCAIQYERFPYPLEQIRGLVTARNGQYQLADLQGRDRQGLATITCSGRSRLDEDGLALALLFQGANVPLDENLKQSLSPKVQQAWTELRPQGRIDFAAHVEQQPGAPKPKIDVTLQPHDRSVTIEPIFFPYRFEQVDGQAIVSDGRVELRNLQGVHGRSTFMAGGAWQANPEGGWQLALNGLNVDRLTFEPDLLQAMPPGVQKVVERLRPSGSFNVYSSALSFARASSGQVAAAWDVQLGCHQAALRGELPLENLTGGIRLMGQANGANSASYGELAIDSLVWNNFQLTNIHGPFWTDSGVCYLGQGATEKLSQPPRRITADVFSGTIATDIKLIHAGQPRYNAEISLGAVDLGRIARERMGGPNDLTGTVSGKLSLAGAGKSTYAMSGHGDLHVVDANIYRLPVLVALLKVLRNRSPDTTAFDRCDMQFDIRGEHIHFTQLNLLGDAVSLYGRGETNLDRRLNLVFYTLVGPADLPIPLWKTVAGRLSEQGLQLKVEGTWDDPQIRREAFPMVNQMLEQAGQSAGVVAPPAAASFPWALPKR